LPSRVLPSFKRAPQKNRRRRIGLEFRQRQRTARALVGVGHLFDEVERLTDADRRSRAALMATLNAGFKRGSRVPSRVDFVVMPTA
jgi:hypothetical protein